MKAVIFILLLFFLSIGHSVIAQISDSNQGVSIQDTLYQTGAQGISDTPINYRHSKKVLTKKVYTVSEFERSTEVAKEIARVKSNLDATTDVLEKKELQRQLLKLEEEQKLLPPVTPENQISQDR